MNTSTPLPRRYRRHHTLLHRLLALVLVALGLASCKSNGKNGNTNKLENELDTLIEDSVLYGCDPYYEDSVENQA